jgi:hypothetical protein
LAYDLELNTGLLELGLDKNLGISKAGALALGFSLAANPPLQTLGIDKWHGPIIQAAFKDRAQARLNKPEQHTPPPELYWEAPSNEPESDGAKARREQLEAARKREFEAREAGKLRDPWLQAANIAIRRMSVGDVEQLEEPQGPVVDIGAAK